MPTVKVSTNAGRPVLIAPKAVPDAAAIQIVQPRSGRVVQGQRAGQVVYTPNHGFTGKDRFRFKLGSAWYDVAVTVAKNNRPQAMPDRVSTAHASAVLIDAVKNDHDRDGNPFGLKGVNTPKNGAATIVGGKIRYVPNKGFSGKDVFGYRLIDSEGAIENGTITVDVAKAPAAPPPPPPPAKPPVTPDSKKPYNGRMVGCAVHLDAVGNHRYEYGRPAAFRFRAEHSGTVKTVRWCNRRDTGTGSAHVGYSKGNGGIIRIELRANNPQTNQPSKLVLARTANVAAASLPLYAVLPFQAPFPTTRAGEIYHLVFIQLDSSGRNSISVNMLHTKVPIPFGGNGRFGPFHGDVLTMMCSDNGEKTWRVRDDRGPIFELAYDNDMAYGQGWIYGHDSAQRPIGAVNMARQRYVLDTPETVKGIWFRPRKQNTPTTLLIALKQAGRVVSSITVDPKHITTSTVYDRPVPWMYLAFPEPVQLGANKLYELEFSASQGNYFLAAVQRGSKWGFRDRNIPTHPAAYAEYSDDQGQAWRGWSFTNPVQGLALHKDMDLTCALVLA